MLEVIGIKLFLGLDVLCRETEKASNLLDFFNNQHIEIFLLFLDIGIGLGDDLVYYKFVKFVMVLPLYFCSIIITFFHFITNARITMGSMATYQSSTVYNDKVKILKEMLTIDDTIRTITLSNFHHNYINFNRVAIWKKRDLQDLPLSLKSSSWRIKEMAKMNLSLFDQDKQFKEFLIWNGSFMFHPPGSNLLMSVNLAVGGDD